jgi:hypothetical protein
MKKLVAMLMMAAAMMSPAHAAESLLPPFFLGDWCVTNSDERNTPPPWSFIAYRKKVVGPCKITLSIGNRSLGQGKDDCKMDEAIRTMLHTQLIRYTCKNGKKGFVQIVAEPARRSENGLDMLYIDYDIDEVYWNEQAAK